MASLADPVNILPKTSSITFKKFNSVAIHTLFDLINYIPNRYKDYSIVSVIADVLTSNSLFDRSESAFFATVKGLVIQTTQRVLRSGLSMQTVVIQDDTGNIECVWFRQPYILTTIKKTDYIIVSGTIRKFGNKSQVYVDEYEIIKDEKNLTHTGRLVPVYSEKRGLSSRTIREKMNIALRLLGNNIIDPLPEDLVKQNHLIDEFLAYNQIHFPNDIQSKDKAYSRLAFDELFVIQLSSQIVKHEWKKEKAGHVFDNVKNTKKINRFINHLPFKLTHAQQRVTSEILLDTSKTIPMNRLLQGDVGSGKTVIAAIASYAGYLSGYQTLIMAPTEILAQQHFDTLQKLFQGSNMPTVSLMTGSKKEKNGDIIVGTHALIAKKNHFDKVGLVIVDEQHRFGVKQRASLKDMGINPHLLTMTATPIPRSVCLTLYGELDLSIIDEMPSGRKVVKTYLVPPGKRKNSYDWIKKQVNDGSQVFIICPLIDESDRETMQSVKAVKAEFESLKTIFNKYRLDLLHGKMKSGEKEEVMKNFKNGKTNILVSTSVVEVGVDVPNACVMVIEGAERYGMAQLHQLRGRVGRGNKQSYCLLFTSGNEPKSTQRLSFFSSTTSGFKLAEYDLKHRGAGQLYGIKQHGASDLAISSLSDYDLVDMTRKASEIFMKKYNLTDFTELKNRVDKLNMLKIAKD